ncbi:MAG: MarR family winged helix-turn-helix transcriptional regulator, partial [Candidatus Methylomirabilis sp.]|nr:MarR family winged helix-turn-helix transcriptional regulator [Deltaproteobacteria bacterium]
GQILAILSAKGDSRLGAVAADLGVKPATASVAVEALAEKGLVSKQWSKADSRALVIRLSAAGRREAKRVATWPDFLLDAVEALSEVEQEVFLKALIKMIRGLQERGEISTVRMCLGCRFFRPGVHADPERPHHCAFVDAPFGDGQLRLDCPDFEAAAPEEAQENFLKWSHG